MKNATTQTAPESTMNIEAQAQAVAAQTGKPVAVCRAGLLWTAADIAEAHGIGDPKTLRASAMRILQGHAQQEAGMGR